MDSEIHTPWGKHSACCSANEGCNTVVHCCKVSLFQSPSIQPHCTNGSPMKWRGPKWLACWGGHAMISLQKWSIRTSRIHALPFGEECALFIPVVRTESFNYFVEIPFKKTWLFSGTGLLPLITAIGDGFPSQLVNLPTSGLWDFTKLPMNSQYGRICNPSMACWHDSLLSNNHLEPCSWSPRTSEENPSRSKDDMTKTLFSSWEHSLNPWHSQDYEREIDGTQHVLHSDIWHSMTSIIRMPIETVSWIWVLSVKSPNLIYSFAYFTYFKTLSSSHGTATCICTWCGIRTWRDFLDRFVSCEHHRLAHIVMRCTCRIVFI